MPQEEKAVPGKTGVDMAPPVEGAEPDNGTLALSFYQAARAEIVQRIGLRESTLIAWITSAGVLIGGESRNRLMPFELPRCCRGFP